MAEPGEDHLFVVDDFQGLLGTSAVGTDDNSVERLKGLVRQLMGRLRCRDQLLEEAETDRLESQAARHAKEPCPRCRRRRSVSTASDTHTAEEVDESEPSEAEKEVASLKQQLAASNSQNRELKQELEETMDRLEELGGRLERQASEMEAQIGLKVGEAQAQVIHEWDILREADRKKYVEDLADVQRNYEEKLHVRHANAEAQEQPPQPECSLYSELALVRERTDSEVESVDPSTQVDLVKVGKVDQPTKAKPDRRAPERIAFIFQELMSGCLEMIPIICGATHKTCRPSVTPQSPCHDAQDRAGTHRQGPTDRDYA